MTIRRFNYTDRKRINRSDVLISVAREDGGGASFDATVDLVGYELPGDSQVFIEAYKRTHFRRFSFGTVATFSPRDGTSLNSLGDVENLLFRVKVVDTTAGQLLAEADGIAPGMPEAGNQPSLLRVGERDLGGELWLLDIDEGGPVLYVHNRWPREYYIRSPEFRWMVLPQVFRQLVLHALLDWDPDSEEVTWQSTIMAQAEDLAGSAPPKQEADQHEWVTTAVRGFCRRHQFLRKHSDDLFRGEA